jgi:hypothetical protein
MSVQKMPMLVRLFSTNCSFDGKMQPQNYLTFFNLYLESECRFSEHESEMIPHRIEKKTSLSVSNWQNAKI